MGMASVNARRRQEIVTQSGGQRESGEKIIRFREDGVKENGSGESRIAKAP